MLFRTSLTTLVLLLVASGPLVADQMIETKLIASDIAAGDRFGVSVALHGNTALVGARQDDDKGLDSGSAYVFVWNGSSWAEEAKLTATDGAAGNWFGHSVALDGDTAVVGAYQAYGSDQNSGAAYVFVRSGTIWVQVAKLVASGGAAGDQFGVSVAVDGDTVLVGANAYGSYSGAAYVFVRDGANWIQQAQLLPSDGESGDNFGNSVALDGDTALVGSLKDDGQRGSAYVFVQNGPSWTQQAKLTASDGTFGDGDRFGFSVAVDGDTALVGAHNDSSSGWRRGAVFVYTRIAGTWSEEAKLTASDGANDDRFGNEVALEGNVALIAAYQDDDLRGSTYQFSRTGAIWTEGAKLTATDGANEDLFGASVALDCGIVIVGAGWADQNALLDSGAAYIFQPNAPPTAVAGEDQSIRAGDIVFLNGMASFDDNTPTELLVYEWSFSSIPEGSSATLDDADTVTPSFLADLPGTYVVDLVVFDEGGLPSSTDQVEVSSDNLAPTAAAGNDQLVITGTTVPLDASASTDPENDALTYFWTITSAPGGSTATIVGADTATPSLVPDLDGLYLVTLEVSDFVGPGLPDVVGITATTAEELAEIRILESSDDIAALPPTAVTTRGNQRAHLNFLNQAILAIQEGDLATAVDKLQKAMARTDGCVLRGAPDGNGPGRDWITDCTAQHEVYVRLSEALAALTAPSP
jgi:hypothetical protein